MDYEISYKSTCGILTPRDINFYGSRQGLRMPVKNSLLLIILILFLAGCFPIEERNTNDWKTQLEFANNEVESVSQLQRAEQITFTLVENDQPILFVNRWKNAQFTIDRVSYITETNLIVDAAAPFDDNPRQNEWDIRIVGERSNANDVSTFPDINSFLSQIMLTPEEVLQLTEAALPTINQEVSRINIYLSVYPQIQESFKTPIVWQVLFRTSSVQYGEVVLHGITGKVLYIKLDNQVLTP